MDPTAGGGPASPDLLSLAYGAGAALVRRPGPTVARALARQHVDAATSARIVEAHEAIGDFGLLFQAVDVQHTWAPASYSCAINLRQFLGLGNFEAVGRGATDVGARQGVA